MLYFLFPERMKNSVKQTTLRLGPEGLFLASLQHALRKAPAPQEKIIKGDTAAGICFVTNQPANHKLHPPFFASQRKHRSGKRKSVMRFYSFITCANVFTNSLKSFISAVCSISEAAAIGRDTINCPPSRIQKVVFPPLPNLIFSTFCRVR